MTVLGETVLRETMVGGNEETERERERERGPQRERDREREGMCL